MNPADELTLYMIEAGLLALETIEESGDALSVTAEGYEMLYTVSACFPETAASCQATYEADPTDDGWMKAFTRAAVRHFYAVGDTVAITLIERIKNE